MDLLAHAHTVHQDRLREIEAMTRHRRWLAPLTAPVASTERPSPAVDRRRGGGQPVTVPGSSASATSPR